MAITLSELWDENTEINDEEFWSNMLPNSPAQNEIMMIRFSVEECQKTIDNLVRRIENGELPQKERIQQKISVQTLPQQKTKYG